MPDAAYFRERAKTCRELAVTLDEQTDGKMRKALVRLADEYEAHAEKLEAMN